jgi:hypothetical protein
VDAFLSAFSGYVPWLAIIVLALIFRKQTSALIASLVDRVKGGASISVGPVKVGELVTTTADAERVAEAQGDRVLTFGDPDRLKLLFKAQGSTWTKSTKAMDVPGGCLVQVSNERQSDSGEWTVAEALAYVPGARVKTLEGGGFALGDVT